MRNKGILTFFGCIAFAPSLAFVPVKRSVHSSPSAVRSTPNLLYTSTDNQDVVDKPGFMPSSPKVCYGALTPGDMVQIRVGDVTQSRKAWKKRRRSGSPLLVPCSILSIDQECMIRWNAVHILYKYGERTSLDKYERIGGGPGGSRGLAMPVEKMLFYYERELGGPLRENARALGFDSAKEMVVELLDERYMRNTGIDIIREDDENILIYSCMSYARARELASSAAKIQFESNAVIEDNFKEHRKLPHTGLTKVLDGHDGRRRPLFRIEPLSTALRVSQSDVDEGRINEGAVHNCFVLSHDEEGDCGNPLLTLSLDATRGLQRDRMKLQTRSKRDWMARKAKMAYPVSMDQNFKYRLKDLKVGDTLNGTVTRLSTHAGAAFVDCSVGRKQSKQKGGGVTRVLGMLRFDDMVATAFSTGANMEEMTEEEAIAIESSLNENREDEDWDDEEVDDLAMIDNEYTDNKSIKDRDEMTMSASSDGVEGEETEEWEDVTDLFAMSDGLLKSVDPETGEAVPIASLDDPNEGYDDEDDDMFSGMSPQERLEAIAEMLGDEESEEGEVSPEDIKNMMFEDEEDDEEGEEISMSTPGKQSQTEEGQQEKTPARDEDPYKPRFVSLGDEVEVYVKMVFPQSGRFMVTLDPSVKGRKAKDLKKEKEADKRLSKLAAKFGGEEGLQRIMDLAGTESTGVVKAKSKTGHWFYVQPEMEKIPVAVAQAECEYESVSEGDSVRVRFEGIDESRGQVAMTVLEKLAP